MLRYVSKWLTQFGMLCTLLVSTSATFAAARLTLESPTEVSNLAIPPGGSAIWVFRVRNNGDSAGPADFGLQERRYGDTAFDQYQWTSLTAGCGEARSAQFFSQMVLTLPISSLAVNEARTCSYRIERSAASRDDLGFRLCSFENDWNNCYRHTLNIGSLPDTTLRVEHVGPAMPGSSASLFRLTAINQSDFAITSRVATTACREFAGGVFDSTPYLIETGFPGSCGTALGEICLNFTGQNFDAMGFELGPIPAQGSNSCLIKLVPRPVSLPTWFNLGPYTTPMYFRNDQVVLADGAIAFDPNAENDRAILGAPDSHPVPINRFALIGLALLLCGLAVWSLRRTPNLTRS